MEVRALSGGPSLLITGLEKAPAFHGLVAWENPGGGCFARLGIPARSARRISPFGLTASKLTVAHRVDPAAQALDDGRPEGGVVGQRLSLLLERHRANAFQLAQRFAAGERPFVRVVVEPGKSGVGVVPCGRGMAWSGRLFSSLIRSAKSLGRLRMISSRSDETLPSIASRTSGSSPSSSARAWIFASEGGATSPRSILLR